MSCSKDITPTDVFSGYRYCRRHDLTAATRITARLWCCMCYDVKVSHPHFNVISVHMLTFMLYSRHPDDLYKNGIQRSSFFPAIDLLKTRFKVTDLNSGTGMSTVRPSSVFLTSCRLQKSAPCPLPCLLRPHHSRNHERSTQDLWRGHLLRPSRSTCTQPNR